MEGRGGNNKASSSSPLYENAERGSLRELLDRASISVIEQIQRKFQVRGSTSEDSPRIRAGVEKKEQQAELKTTKARSR